MILKSPLLARTCWRYSSRISGINLFVSSGFTFIISGRPVYGLTVIWTYWLCKSVSMQCVYRTVVQVQNSNPRSTFLRVSPIEWARVALWVDLLSIAFWHLDVTTFFLPLWKGASSLWQWRKVWSYTGMVPLQFNIQNCFKRGTYQVLFSRRWLISFDDVMWK